MTRPGPKPVRYLITDADPLLYPRIREVIAISGATTVRHDQRMGCLSFSLERGSLEVGRIQHELKLIDYAIRVVRK